MVKKILIGVAILIAAFAAFVASRPDEFKVERSTTVAAPAAMVFAYTNDLHRWEKWSPWDKLDPAMKREFSGAEAGVGASYAWAGNKQVGEGRMTITESAPNEKVVMRLEFIKPFQATNQVTLTSRQVGETTHVTWAIAGKQNFLFKAFFLFQDMDAMMGKDFESGLSSLKNAVEEDARNAAAAAPAAAPAGMGVSAAPVATTK